MNRSESDFAPLVPPGEYGLKLVEHRTGIFFKTPRLVLDLQISDFGEYHGVLLHRYYNVARLIGKPGKNGHCKHKLSGDFMMEYYRLFPTDPRLRLDRISLQKFYNQLLIGRVRTVGANNRQQKLPDQLMHSVVGELVGVAE